MKIHLGCGPYFLQGWINVDYSFGARIANIPLVGGLAKSMGLFHIEWNPNILLHDLSKPLPWPDASADCIYTSHTLEHLRREDGERLIAECHRVLKPGGVLRIVVPDLKTCVEDYLNGEIPCERFIESLLVIKSKSASWKHKLLSLVDDRHLHKCMYDTPGLVRILNQYGFKAASMAAHQSKIPDIETAEKVDRTIRAVVVEGIK
jgi:predicted SAM-dependent methyltransferase